MAESKTALDVKMSAGKGEETQTQHVPSPKSSRRSTLITGDEDRQEPDSVNFIQKQRKIESADNPEGILLQSKFCACHQNESNTKQSPDGRISKVMNIEEEAQDLSSLKLIEDKDMQHSNALLFLQKDVEENDVIEIRAPDFPVRRKSLATIPDQHVFTLRRYSMVENIAKAEQTEEDLSNEFVQRLPSQTEEVTNQSCKSQFISKDEKQCLSSPKSFRRRKSLVKTKNGQPQQQNYIGKTDDIKMSQFTKKSGRKKSIQRECDEKHSHLHRKRNESNVISGEDKIHNETSNIHFVQVNGDCNNDENLYHDKHKSGLRDEDSLMIPAPTNVHQGRKSFSKSEEIDSHMCSLLRGNCSIGCEEMSHVTKVTHGNDRRKSMINYEHCRTQTNGSSKSLYRRMSVGMIEGTGTGTKLSVSNTQLASTHSARRMSGVGSYKGIDDALNPFQPQKQQDALEKVQGTCKSQNVNRKKKKTKKVSRSGGRPIHNTNNSLEHHEDIYDKSVLSPGFCHNNKNTNEETTQESITPLNLIQELENMNIHALTSTRSMLIGDSDDGRPVTYWYENGSIDSQALVSTYTDEIKQPIEDFMTAHVHKRKKSIQDAESIRRQTSLSPRRRKRSKNVKKNDTCKRIASPLVRQREQSQSLCVQRKIINADEINSTVVQDADDVKRPSSRSPRMRQRRKHIQNADGIKTMTSISPLTRQRRESFDDTKSPISRVLHERRMSIQDAEKNDSQASVSPIVQERRSIQDAELSNETPQLIRLEADSKTYISKSPHQQRRIHEANVNNQASTSPCPRQRRKSIQDSDMNSQLSMSPRVQRRRKSIQDSDMNSQLSMSPRLQRRRKSIQDSDMNSQLSMSPRVQRRRKSIQDSDMNCQLSTSLHLQRRIFSFQDADVHNHACISPCERQRRKSIHDADVNCQLSMSPCVQRRKSIQDIDMNSQLSMSTTLRRRIPSFQDADVNNQVLLSPRSRHRRKSIQDADLKTQTTMSPLARPKLIPIDDSNDALTYTHGYPSLQRSRKTIQDKDENMRQGLRRKSIQDLDDAMMHVPLSPRSQQLRTYVQTKDDNKSLLQSPPHLQDIKSQSPYNYEMREEHVSSQPILRQESIPEDDINISMGIRAKPRRKSLQDREKIVPQILSPHAVFCRGHYLYDSEGTTDRSLFSPSFRRRKQMNDRTNLEISANKDGQVICRPPFDYGNLGPSVSETMSIQIPDNSVFSVSGAGTSDVDLIKPQRKRSLSLSNIHNNEVSNQSHRDANSSTVLSFNLDVQQRINGQASPSCGREMKPTLIQKEIREKLAKSARRSSFSAVSGSLDPFNMDPFSVLKGRNLEIKQVEQVENMGPFSRRARKASLLANQIQSGNCPDKETERPRKMSMPVNMLTHFMPQDNERVTQDVSFIQHEANSETFQHKTRIISQVSEAMAPDVVSTQHADNFDGVRRKTRRMSLPDIKMFSNLRDFPDQSFCHQIPGHIRRIAATRPIKNPFEQQNNLCLQRPSNPCGDDKNFPSDIAACENIYPSINSEDTMQNDEVFKGEGDDDVEFEELSQSQTPEVSPVIKETDEEEKKEEKEEITMSGLYRQDSVTSDITLPPRTPEPEVMTEFKDGNAEGSQTDGQSYKPRYCWCTRCKLMYRMYKDDDSGLESWGNYPCFKF